MEHEMEQQKTNQAKQASGTAEFGGNCAFALSVGKQDVPGSSDHCVVEGDKTYYFSNGVARLLWKVLPNREKKANATWATR